MQTMPTTVVTTGATKAVAADRAKYAVVAGRSSKPEVLAALGESLVIRFDSGYEVWVYRLDKGSGKNARIASLIPSDSDANVEFVILFEPSGLVAKSRIRAGPERLGERR